MAQQSNSPAGPGQLPSSVALQRMISGYTTSQVIYVAAKLGLADLLAAGPRSAAELAAATTCDQASLARFLRAMMPLAIVTATPDGKFAIGRLGDHLRSDAAGSLRNFAIHAGEEQYQAWGEALHTVRTGEPAFLKRYGTTFYEHMAANPDRDSTWNQSMDETERAWVIELGLVSSYDWSGVTTVVDIGGGHGILLAAILQGNPALRGILYDLPNVVQGAADLLARDGLQARCRVLGGDFFASVPRGGDAYLLSRVLFNWDDDDALRILAACRRAMPPGARLLIIEPIVTGEPTDLASLIDLNVFLVCGGKTRTEAEHRALLAAAELRFRRLIDTPAAWGIIEAFAEGPRPTGHR